MDRLEDEDVKNRLIQPRRLVHQARNRIDEALAVVERNEDARSAVDDIESAIRFLNRALKTLKPQAQGWERGIASLFKK